MGKETSQIKRFHCIEDAYFGAFSFVYEQERPKEKDGDYHMSFSNDHSKLESSNPAGTIEVATFLKNKKRTPNETIKKEYYYVCEFKWKSYGERKDFFDFEEAKKMRERPPTIRTDHLLFMIYWEDDFNCWQRVHVFACLNASSHQEAADWMLKEITTKGSDVPEHGSEYFKNGTLEVIK